MPIFSTLIFAVVRWAARKGLGGERGDASEGLELQRRTPRGRRGSWRRGGPACAGRPMRIGICDEMDMCLWLGTTCRAGRKVRSI
jgi:hypothetical protein